MVWWVLPVLRSFRSLPFPPKPVGTEFHRYIEENPSGKGLWQSLWLLLSMLAIWKSVSSVNQAFSVLTEERNGISRMNQALWWDGSPLTDHWWYVKFSFTSPNFGYTEVSVCSVSVIGPLPIAEWKKLYRNCSWFTFNEDFNAVWAPFNNCDKEMLPWSPAFLTHSLLPATLLRAAFTSLFLRL